MQIANMFLAAQAPVRKNCSAVTNVYRLDASTPPGNSHTSQLNRQGV